MPDDVQSAASEALPSLIKQIEKRLRLVETDMHVMREKEFFNDPDFLTELSMSTLNRLITVMDVSITDEERSRFCASESEQNHVKAIDYNSPHHQELSLAMGALGVKFLKADYPIIGMVINIFAKSLRRRWVVSGVEKHLDDMIYYFAKAIELGSLDYSYRGLHHDDLGCALLEKFRKTADTAYFDDAKSNFEYAIASEDTEVPLHMSNLGRLLKEMALHTKSAETSHKILEEGLVYHVKAINALTSAFRHPLQLPFLHFAQIYFELDVLDPTNPIESLRADVRQCVDSSGHRWMFYYHLSALHTNRFNLLGNAGDLDIAIGLLRACLLDSSNSDILCSLSRSLRLKALRENSIAIITEAVDYVKQGLNASPSVPDAAFPGRLLDFSYCLFSRYEMTGSMEDLNISINASHLACRSILPENTERWKYLEALALELLHRFQVTGQSNDINLALSSIQSALEYKGMAMEVRVGCLRQLGKIHYEAYRVQNGEKHLQLAIEAYNEGISLSKPNNPELSQCYNDKGNALQKRFQDHGDPEDLRESISCYLKALECLDSVPNILSVKRERSMYLTGLGNSYYIEFERWSTMEPLDHAISIFEKALEAAEPFERIFAKRVLNYSRALRCKADITEDRELLDKSASLVQSTLQQDPPSQEHFHLNNTLAAIFYSIYRRSNESSYYDRAIEHLRKALSLGGDPISVFVAENNLLLLLFQDVAENPTSGDRLLTATAQFHSYIQQDELADSWSKRVRWRSIALCSKIIHQAIQKNPNLAPNTVGGIDFKYLASEFYQQMLQDVEVPSAERIQCVFSLIDLRGEDSHSVVEWLAMAIELLPDAVLISANREDQMQLLKEIWSLPIMVLLFNLAAGNSAFDALRVYERSRCVILDRLFDRKNDITDLESKHHDLAQRFMNLHRLLAQKSPSVVMENNFIDVINVTLRQNYRDLALEYKDLISSIRKEDGFEHFLMLPSTISSISHYSQNGAIVLVNDPGILNRCFAVIIQGEMVSHLELPGVTNEACLRYGAEMFQALKEMSQDLKSSQATLDSVLLWLWEAVACPILRNLGHYPSEKDNKDTPRIWWIQNGFTSLFPIHAAGDHKAALKTGECCTVIDNVISSYIPTLKALDFVRTRAKHVKQTIDQNRAVVVAYMPTTPEEADLLGAHAEMEVVQRTFANVVALNCPTRSDLVLSLEDCAMAHFVCHGGADTYDPSRSMLLLQDWETNPFDIQEILVTPMEGCEFVFLSACETAADKVVKLREEVIQISSAFHMAGVPYAIATKWSIDDSISVKIADIFYKGLMKSGDVDFGKSAEKLRDALLVMKKNKLPAIFWGSYIHSGA